MIAPGYWLSDKDTNVAKIIKAENYSVTFLDLTKNSNNTLTLKGQEKNPDNTTLGNTIELNIPNKIRFDQIFSYNLTNTKGNIYSFLSLSDFPKNMNKKDIFLFELFSTQIFNKSQDYIYISNISIYK